jgi:cytochrome c
MHSQTYHRLAISSLLLVATQCAMAQLSPANNTASAGSAIKGKEIYSARCSACHSVDDNRVGPMHLGVFGRKAGSVKNYQYSAALSKSKVVWGRDNLLAWLKNPEAVIPGQSMGYSLDITEDRNDVVAYLATLK